MEEKRVVSIDEIVFEKANITIPKGTVYKIDEVVKGGVVLSRDGEQWLIDFETFENGFAIAE